MLLTDFTDCYLYQLTYLKNLYQHFQRHKQSLISPSEEPPVEVGKLSPIPTYSIPDSDSSDEDVTPRPNKDKKVDFAAGSDVISLTMDERTEKEGDTSVARGFL